MVRIDDPVAEIVLRIWQNDMRHHTMRDTKANRAMIADRRDGLLEALSVVDAYTRSQQEGGVAVELRTGQKVYDAFRAEEQARYA